MAKQRGALDGGWGEEATNYVTLAKAGGRKDLLQHIAFSGGSHEPVSYSTVDWFAHPSPPPPTHDPSATPHLPPLDHSLLQWPASLKEAEPRRGRKKPQREATHVLKNKSKKPLKLPKVEPAVDMVRVLSMDYQREWLEERGRQARELRRRARERRAAQRRKLEEHTLRARVVAGVEGREVEKPRFIMKRFANVPARVKLPPLTTSPPHPPPPCPSPPPHPTVSDSSLNPPPLTVTRPPLHTITHTPPPSHPPPPLPHSRN